MASWRHAQEYIRNGRHLPAITSLRRLLEEFPGVAQLWFQLGVAAVGELDFPLANQAFDRALESEPGDAELLMAVGMQYYRLRQMDKALTCHQLAVAAAPSSAHARLTLASWYERDRRTDEAWECVETCLKQNPNDGKALYFKAFLLHGRKRHGEAESVLRDLIAPSRALPIEVRADALHMLAVILDALEQYGEAWSFLEQSKALRLKASNISTLEKTYDAVGEARRKMLSPLNTETMQQWREEAAESPGPNPMVLLGGPPRSGTTLIEQILGAHPDVFIFDEPPAYAQEIFHVLHPPPPAPGLSFKTLNGLPADGRVQLMGRYFKSLLRETREKPAARFWLDKNPSITASLYIWLRMFPQSKVIIALRDPRDILISCYFQQIPVTWGNVNFLRLERTAAFYADIMKVWLRMREVGGFDWIETRYEDVVANLEGEGKRITEFLGLTWNDGQAAYYKTAGKKFVHSPTYNEVAQPVYSRAVQRWKHYSAMLEPAISRLEPYLKAFGY